MTEYENILNQLSETYKAKNADYGDSFSKLFKEFGITSSIIRLTDKLNRVKSISNAVNINVADESLEDTLLDMASYAIMTVVELRKMNYKPKHAE